MSWLSDNLGSVAGGLSGLGFGTGIGAYVGGKYGQEYQKQLNGLNDGGNGGSPQGLSLSPQGQEMANNIIKYIQSKNLGTYGEAQIGAAVQSFDDLENKVKNGQLSQSDYVQISNAILPQVYDWAHKVAGSGSSAATAANNAGLQKLSEHYAKYNIYKSGQEMLGRDLSPDEIAQALPIFSQANGQQLGNAWLANLKKADEQNPNSKTNQNKAAGFGNQVNDYFKNMLGRDATPDEKAHFGSLMATGNLDAYGMSQFLQGTPEYQGKENEKFQQGLTQKLTDADMNFFNRAKQNVLSQFMQQGTSNSTALDSALTDLMGQIADKRSQYMADLSAKQYGGNQDLAVGNYKDQMGQYLNEQGYNRGVSSRNMDYLQGRSNELTDYQRQMDDYMKFYGSQQPSNTMNNINTGLNTVNTGVNLFRYLGGR